MILIARRKLHIAERPRTWQNFMTEIRAAIDENRADGGAGIRFLTETVTSPTLDRTIQTTSNRTSERQTWYQYEPVNNDNAMAGAKMAFGSPAHTVYKFDQAERILSLDADIFSGFNVRYIKDFAKGRSFTEEKKDINRLYTVETTMTLTGAKADHRLAVKPSQMTGNCQSDCGGNGRFGSNFDLYGKRYNGFRQWRKICLHTKENRSLLPVIISRRWFTRLLTR